MDNLKLRYGLELLPAEHEGQRMFVLRDGIGYSEHTLLLSPPVAGLLAQMNGGNSMRDLQAQFLRMTGRLLFTEDLAEIAKQLDECLFLENERFVSHVSRQVSRFMQDPIRRMQFADKSYPADPESLRKHLAEFFRAAPETSGPSGGGHESKRLFGLAAPHIDLQAGGSCFAHAYKASRENDSPETWVILGTGHQQVENYFTLTPKDFETPLGLVGCDREFCEELSRLVPRDLRASEYNHHREHSIEFQTVFLSFTHPGSLIVPLLCSFSPEEWETDRGYIDQVARTLGELARTSGRSVGFLASVDLAHIGPRYGDSFRPGPATVTEHLADDRRLLQSIEKCDAEEFMQRIRREQDRRRICGLAPLYTLAKALEGRARGEILNHSYATVDSQNSFVTFVSMAFYASQQQAVSG